MGYRSEVRSAIYGSNDKIQALKQTPEFAAVAGHFDSYITEHKLNDTTSAIMLHGDGFKWYDSYLDVQAWHTLLDLAREQKLSGEFVRVGEEASDVEVDNFGDDCDYYIYPVQSIECSFL